MKNELYLSKWFYIASEYCYVYYIINLILPMEKEESYVD